MGTRSRFALVSGSPGHLAEIAERCKPLLQHFDNPINYSLVCMAAAPCEPLAVGICFIAFQSREVFGFSKPPAIIKDLLQLSPLQSATSKPFWSFFGGRPSREEVKAIDAAWNDVLKTPALAIAKIASEVTGESLCVIYSDSSCSSGLLRWVDGGLEAGAIYGAGGTDVLFTFKSNEARPSMLASDSNFNYADTIVSGLRSYFGESFDVDWFLSEGPEEYQRFVLMEGRALVTPARIET